MPNKVLILDDEKIITILIKDALKNLNFEMAVFTDSLKALDECKNNFYDLIITDIMMPQLNGIEFIEQIKLSGSCLNSAVLIISAKKFDETDKRIIFNNNCRYLRKPFTSRQVLETVKEILNI